MTRLVTTTDEVVAAIDGGLLVGFATDTVYGIAASVRTSGAAAALSGAKGRSAEVPLQVLVSGLDQARSIAIFSAHADRIATTMWPGALTLVLERNPEVSIDLGVSIPTVGLRWPAHPITEELCERCGPLLATSANRHGQEPATSASEVARIFSGILDVVLEGGTCGGSASTVVDLSVDPPRFLRIGAVPQTAILEAL